MWLSVRAPMGSVPVPPPPPKKSIKMKAGRGTRQGKDRDSESVGREASLRHCSQDSLCCEEDMDNGPKGTGGLNQASRLPPPLLALAGTGDDHEGRQVILSQCKVLCSGTAGTSMIWNPGSQTLAFFLLPGDSLLHRDSALALRHEEPSAQH